MFRLATPSLSSSMALQHGKQLVLDLAQLTLEGHGRKCGLRIADCELGLQIADWGLRTLKKTEYRMYSFILT